MILNVKNAMKPAQYFRSMEEMAALFEAYPQALENTVEIAKRCNVEITLDNYVLPEFPTQGQTPADFLVVQAQKWP